MSLRELMLEGLARGLRVVRDSHELVPAWRITTPEGHFMILTRFDPDKPGQREQVLTLVPGIFFLIYCTRISCDALATGWAGEFRKCTCPRPRLKENPDE
jgi:hypothetical protein